MNLSKLKRTRKKIADFRNQSAIKSGKLESLAKKLGRVLYKRGKEPTWVSEQFPELSPLSIPHHSKDVNKYTAGGILDQLELDLERWEEVLKS